MGSLDTHFGWSRIEIDGKQYVVTDEVKEQVHSIMSQNAQAGRDKAKEYVDKNGICFCNMRYDASFKHIYSVDNYRHSLSFARDVATLTGHTALARRIAIVEKHNFERTSLETELSSRTTQEKELDHGNHEVHIREPDVMCTANRGVRVHVEMQQKNNGDIERRTKEYENLADRYFGTIPTVGLSVNAYVNPNWSGLNWSDFSHYKLELKRLRTMFTTLTVRQTIDSLVAAERLNQLVSDIKCLIELVDSGDESTVYPQDIREIEIRFGQFITTLSTSDEIPKASDSPPKKKKLKDPREALCSKFKAKKKNLETCYVFEKSDDLMKVNCVNLDGIEQLNVAIYLGNTDKIRLGATREKSNFSSKIQEIRKKWRAEINKRKIGKRGKERTSIEEAGERLCQRNIAFQYLQHFSEKDFKKYITDKTVKEECNYMSVRNYDDGNLERPDILEQLISLYDFDEQVKLAKSEGEIEGKISEIIKFAPNDKLLEALLDLPEEYPQHHKFITKTLADRSVQISDRRKKGIINSAIDEIGSAQSPVETKFSSSAPQSKCSSPQIRQNKRTSESPKTRRRR
ncbi:MAG: hypothetical protein K2L13_01605 [Opitutales bacterium]|nr:hypothetical protein [Opitutales bacterium]